MALHLDADYSRSCTGICRMTLVQIKAAGSLPLITNAETTLIFIYLFFVTSLISQADPATFPIVRKF